LWPEWVDLDYVVAMRLWAQQILVWVVITLPVLFDEEQELSRLFTVRGLPTTVLIGQDGHALGRAIGPRAWDSQESIALVRHVLDRQP